MGSIVRRFVLVEIDNDIAIVVHFHRYIGVSRDVPKSTMIRVNVVLLLDLYSFFPRFFLAVLAFLASITPSFRHTARNTTRTILILNVGVDVGVANVGVRNDVTRHGRGGHE